MITLILFIVMFATRHFLLNENDDTAILEVFAEAEAEAKAAEEKLELYDIFSSAEYIGGKINNRKYHQTFKSQETKGKRAKTVKFKKYTDLVEQNLHANSTCDEKIQYIPYGVVKNQIVMWKIYLPETNN